MEALEPVGELGGQKTHLAVFTAQPMCTHSVWLQGTGGGIAAETRTFLERGTGFIWQGQGSSYALKLKVVP